MFESKKIKALEGELETLRKQLDIYKDKEIVRLPKSNICKNKPITGVTTTNPFEPIQYYKFGASGTFSPQPFGYYKFGASGTFSPQPFGYYKFGASGTFSPTNKLSTINN